VSSLRLTPGERAGSYQRTRVADTGPGSGRASSQRFLPPGGSLRLPSNRPGGACSIAYSEGLGRGDPRGAWGFPPLFPVRRLPSLSHPHQAGASFEEKAPPGGFIPTLCSVPGLSPFALPIIQRVRTFSAEPHPQPRHRNNKTGKTGKNRKRKSKGSKRGQEHAKRVKCYQVLCVNTEPCANAGGEVRGDLYHSFLLA
jgi:hypothetical protein